MQCERLRRKRQWNHLLARLQTVQASLRQWASSSIEAERHSAYQDPCCVGSTPGRGASANKEEGTESKDPNGIEGITKEFIVHLARAVKDAQQEENIVTTVAAQSTLSEIVHWWRHLESDLHFNQNEGIVPKKGDLGPSRKGDYTEGTPRWDTQGLKHHTQTPFLNPDPFNWWYGIENVARVKVNGESCMALLDNGTQINTIMPGYIKNHSLDVWTSLRPHRAFKSPV